MNTICGHYGRHDRFMGLPPERCKRGVCSGGPLSLKTVVNQWIEAISACKVPTLSTVARGGSGGPPATRGPDSHLTPLLTEHTPIRARIGQVGQAPRLTTCGGLQAAVVAAGRDSGWRS